MRLDAHPEYAGWRAMLQRCRDKKNKYYGGRGIAVHPAWTGKNGFRQFLADVGSKPFSGASLDRIDPNGNYVPGNVRWTTLAEQAKNKRRTRWIDLDGERKSLADWARQIGVVSAGVAQSRLQRGWTPERALRTPARTTKTPVRPAERQALSDAIGRCHNPRHAGYVNYGARGISVYPQWRGAGGLARFVAHIGKRPSSAHSLERKNVNRGYVPHNVCWALKDAQIRNRRVTKWITISGRKQTLMEWARESGLPHATLRGRYRAGDRGARLLRPQQQGPTRVC